MFLHINVCVSHSKLYTIPVYDDCFISSIFIKILSPSNFIGIFDFVYPNACLKSYIFLLLNTAL
nr:MAG TPA_asm: hypothetical protein [Caudoviricetes sp.]